VAEVDLDYSIYYPFLEPYVSLYANYKPGEKGKSGGKDKEKEKDKAEQLLRTPRPVVWTTVEKLREEGKEALERLQNRQPEGMVDVLDKGKSEVKSRTGAGAGGENSEPGKSGAERNGKSLRKGTKWGKRGGRREPELQKGRGSDDGSDSDGGGFFEEG